MAAISGLSAAEIVVLVQGSGLRALESYEKVGIVAIRDSHGPRWLWING
jgi:hypothetical protein